MIERVRQYPIDLGEQGYELWRNVTNDKPRLGRLLPEVLVEREFGFKIIIQSGAFYEESASPEERDIEPSRGSAVWILEKDGKDKLNVIRYEVQKREAVRMVDDAAHGIVKESYDLITGRDKSLAPNIFNLRSLYLLAYERKIRQKGIGKAAPVIDVRKEDLDHLAAESRRKGARPLTVSEARDILRVALRDVFSVNESLRSGAKFDWLKYQGLIKRFLPFDA